MLLTSRPAGAREELFAKDFFHMRLAPLNDAQQQSVMEQRVGSGPAFEALPRYLSERVPIDSETGERVTGNPLLLSVVISIWEDLQRPGGAPSNGQVTADCASPKMPETTIALYELAILLRLMRTTTHGRVRPKMISS